MIFDVLKARWLRKQQEDYRKQTRDRNFSVPHKLVILYDQKSPVSDVELENWKKKLGVQQITKVVLTQDRKSIAGENEVFITPASLKWIGGFADEVLKELMQEQFDLQINYFEKANGLAGLIATALNARLKVGFPSQDEDQYDLAIDLKLSEEDLFFKELVRYLEIIKK